MRCALLSVMRFAGGMIVSLLAVGCGAESSGEGATSTTGTQETSGLSTTTTTATGVTGSTSTGTGTGTGTGSGSQASAAPSPSTSNDTTSVGDEGSSSGAVPTDDRLFPIAVGRSWTYEVTTLGAFGSCGSGTFTEEVLGMVEVGGEAAFEMTSFCTALANPSVFRIEGDLVDLDNDGSWIRVLDEPVQEGHGWNSTGPIDYTWRDAGEVTVPAGTFTDCWTRVQVVAYTAETTFCRGVGMVRSVSSDLGGSGWDAVLTDSRG